MMKSSHRRSAVLVSVALSAATLAVYLQVIGHEFVNFDDGAYVTLNNDVQKGITLESIKWAFTTGHSANWHPLTWISHMLDVELFGLNAGWHHLTNVFLHVANTILLFMLLRRMTNANWQSAFVAALFALHPLHVESVAWVSERKDVLSALFWILTIWAYIRYVEQPSLRRYLLIAAALALGLMAKPMLVTLPFVLLLLDYWPLNRLSGSVPATQTSVGVSEGGSTPSYRDRVEKLQPRKSAQKWIHVNWKSLPPLIREKIPLVVLAFASSVVTFIAQQSGGAVEKIQNLPLDLRIFNALASYFNYIRKLIWPLDLAVIYPHPGVNVSLAQVGAGALLLVVGSILALRAVRHSYLVVGWFWYLGTLVPVIGIVQVGYQAMADRYTYVPLIGLFVLIAWGISSLFARGRVPKLALAAVAAVVLSLCAFLTWSQVRTWRDSVTLMKQAVQVTRNNWVAHGNLGVTLPVKGRTQEALEHLREAVRANPGYWEAYYNMAGLLTKENRRAEAIEHYLMVIKLNPKHADAHNNLGVLLTEEGKVVEALAHYHDAIQLRSHFPEAQKNLAGLLAKEGRVAEAISRYREALKLQPGDATIHSNLGALLAREGQLEEGISHLQEALRIDPSLADAHNDLGITFAMQARNEEAISHFSEAVRLNPQFAAARFNLGLALAKAGKIQEAMAEYAEAIRIKPDYLDARRELDKLRKSKNKGIPAEGDL